MRKEYRSADSVAARRAEAPWRLGFAQLSEDQREVVEVTEARIVFQPFLEFSPGRHRSQPRKVLLGQLSAPEGFGHFIHILLLFSIHLQRYEK